MSGKHMRMCTVWHRRRAAGSNPAPLSTRSEQPGNHLLSFFLRLTAGKDLLRRRVNTVAMRKSATHDSRDRPATWRYWVGPGPKPRPGGRFDSVKRHQRLQVAVHLSGSRKDGKPPGGQPAAHTQHWCSGNTPAFQAGIAGSSPVCCSSGTHAPVIANGYPLQ